MKLLLNPLHADGTPITDPEVIAGTKTCDDFEWPWGCHTAVPLPNGHILYFNNGYGRNFKLDFTDRKNIYTCGIEYLKKHVVYKRLSHLESDPSGRCSEMNSFIK